MVGFGMRVVEGLQNRWKEGIMKVEDWWRSIRSNANAKAGKRATIFYVRQLIMERERKTNLAIAELGLQAGPEQGDKYELGEILVDILGYPTVEEAELHQRANRLGNFDLLSEQNRLIDLLNSKDTQQLKLCACCGNIVNQTAIPYLSGLEEVKVGVGVRLYFLTLLYHVLLFLVGFFLYSLYALITNVNASKEELENLAALCSADSECSTANIGLGSKLMSYDSFRNQLAIQSVLGFMYVLIWGIVLVNKDYRERRLEYQLRKEWVSASDFTLMLRDFPKGLLDHSPEQNLRNLNDLFHEYEKQVKSKVSFEVVKVSIGYPLYRQHSQQQQARNQAELQMRSLRQPFTTWLQQRQHSDCFLQPEDKRNELYERFYDFMANVYYKPDHQRAELAEKNVLFVTLRYSQARELIENLNRPRSKLLSLCANHDRRAKPFPVAHTRIERAPEPEEIKWENIGFESSARLCRRILAYLLALILIGGSLAVGVVLGSWQSSNRQYYTSLVISLVITVVNYLMELLIILLSMTERAVVKSQEEASIGVKVAGSQILNSIAVPLALTYLGGQPIFASGGLVTNVFFIALLNALLPIGRFIDPFHLVLRLREKYYSDPHRRLLQLQGQPELNRIFAYNEFELGYEYAYILKTSFLTAFFLTLQPVIALFAPVGLGLMFFTNKYRLLYRLNKPHFHSGAVNSTLAPVLQCSLLGFALGQLYFMNFQAYSLHFNLVINWVSVGLAILFVLFPLRACRALRPDLPPTPMDFKEKQLYLGSDYDRLNPLTKEAAIDEFRDYLEQYEKKCHLPLPEKSQMIRMSLLEVQRNLPASLLVAKEKTRIVPQRSALGSVIHTAERLR